MLSSPLSPLLPVSKLWLNAGIKQCEVKADWTEDSFYKVCEFLFWYSRFSTAYQDALKFTFKWRECISAKKNSCFSSDEMFWFQKHPSFVMFNMHPLYLKNWNRNWRCGRRALRLTKNYGSILGLFLKRGFKIENGCYFTLKCHNFMPYLI